MNKEIASKFIENLKNTSEKNKIFFKRNPLPTAGGIKAESIMALYSLLPFDVLKYNISKTEESLFIFVASLYFQFEPNEDCVPLEEVIKKSCKSVDNVETRVTTLFKNRVDDDGILLRDLYRLIQLISKKENMNIDCAKLLHDLSCWNHDSYYIQKQWAKTIHSI